MRTTNTLAKCKNCNTHLHSLFETLDPKETSLLNEHKSCSFYKKNQIIFSQNSQAHVLYIICSGKVKLYQLSENGREQIVRMANAGDILGYRALLSNDRYTSSAETIEEANICVIPKEFFFNLMAKNPSITSHLMRILSDDLKKAEHKITDLAQKPVRERMAEAILFIKETYGYEKDNATINVVLTREELANIVGTATETAIRLLSELRQENLIDFIGKKIKILNHARLTELANVND